MKLIQKSNLSVTPRLRKYQGSGYVFFYNCYEKNQNKSSPEEVEICVEEREEKTADVSDNDIFESQSLLSGQEK